MAADNPLAALHPSDLFQNAYQSPAPEVTEPPALTLPEIDEVEKVLETLKFSYVLTMPRHCAGAVAVSAQSLSDLITALLAQRAADAKRIRGLEQWAENWRQSAKQCLAHAEKQEARAEAAEAKVAALEAQVERMRGALEKLACKCPSNCDWEHDDICPSWIARAALTEERT